MRLGFDWWLITPIVVLTALGLTIQSSIAPSLFPVQMGFIAVGIVVFVTAILLGPLFFSSFAKTIYIASVIFLVSPFILGEATRGAFRWVNIGPLVLQPSEIVKPFLIMGFARFFATRRLEKYSELFIGAILVLVPVGLIFVQPDLGSALVVGVGWLAIVASSGFSFKWFWGVITLFLATFPLFWRTLKSYQRDRLISFLAPGSDPLGSGYNVIQAIVAIGSGQLLGRGLGRGTQSHLRFLPENHTDFIFASLSEELGFLGILVLMLSLAIIFLRCLIIAQNTQRNYERLLIIGLTGMLFFQTFVNIAMNLGLLPVTGIPLPLVSYGGSSIVSTFFSLGIVYGIGLRYRQKETLRVS